MDSPVAGSRVDEPRADQTLLVALDCGKCSTYASPDEVRAGTIDTTCNVRHIGKGRPRRG